MHLLVQKLMRLPMTLPELWIKSSGVNECMVSTGSYNIELETGNLDAGR